MRIVGLSGKIIASMIAITLLAILLVFFTSYLFYYLMDTFWPNYVFEDSFLPEGPELIWVAVTIIITLSIAIAVAVHLARQILSPLESVTKGIRQLAAGDLSARATPFSNTKNETNQLVRDFNLLAEKLEQMTDEQKFWNAAIAHELRTPITILYGRLQGLLDGVFTPDNHQFRSLLMQVDGLKNLVEDLRVVSLEESGHLNLRTQNVNLSTEITAVVEFMKDALAKAQQQVKLDLTVTNAFCDPIRIRQALIALLTNAIKHAIPGTISIQTYIQQDTIILSIEDEGPGIPDTLVPYVFTAFKRSQESETTGSGLGLAVVAAIARAHGGDACCHATEASGTRFEMRWPYKSII
ncbi:ATP-binding protein [Marinomonas spartinae]|uniref:ATP-binding protein n=1 Tax=Marinomonas spartinae TaxID=1792290 RepID=UPI0018F1F8EA|nr:ATP-binding protein [Marinomonas spartinae]MBJ7552713.1 HAMP domain-containing histidine kinase [Marinomonas spartinae]